MGGSVRREEELSGRMLGEWSNRDDDRTKQEGPNEKHQMR